MFGAERVPLRNRRKASDGRQAGRGRKHFISEKEGILVKVSILKKEMNFCTQNVDVDVVYMMEM